MNKFKINKKISCARPRTYDLLLIIALLLPFPHHAEAYEAVDAVQGGRIRGVVRWGPADIPGRQGLTITKNTDFCGKTFLDDALLVNVENRGMQNVVVYLEDIEKGRSPQSRHINVIKKCRFHPRVMAVVKGELIGFRHDDFITHNIHLFRYDNNATLLNFGLPIHRWQQTIIRKNRRTGIFRLQCDIHNHMNGLIVSLEHDYFSVTNADGEFEIDEIPPGKYRIVAFQGGYQIQNMNDKGEKEKRPVYEKPHQITKEIEVRINETSKMVFEFDLRNKPEKQMTFK